MDLIIQMIIVFKFDHDRIFLLDPSALVSKFTKFLVWRNWRIESRRGPNFV